MSSKEAIRRNAFQTGAKIYLSEKNISGLWALEDTKLNWNFQEGLGWGAQTNLCGVFLNNKLIVHVPCLQIRVFTYLVGSEKSATDGPLKEICNDNRGS